MTFLYIILGICLFVALILTFRVSLTIKLNGESFHIYLRIGPVKIKLIPAKAKKVKFKKLARKLKNKKLSEISKTSKTEKKSSDTKKAKKSGTLSKLHGLFGDEDGSDKLGTVKFILDILKKAALEFDRKLHVDISTLNIGVDMGNPHSTALMCADLSQSAAYILELLDRRTVLKIKNKDAVKVFPIQNGGVFICDIFVKIHLSIGSILKSAIKILAGALKSIISQKNIKNQDLTIRKETTK